MTSSRWLGSAHLARAEGGAEALAALRRLPPDHQRDVMTFGDRLAELGLAVAQAYGLQAARARGTMGRREFSAWAGLGLEIAGKRLDSREAAVAYFRLEPIQLFAARHLLERWIDLCAEVQKLSRRLAVSCLESSGRSLHRLGKDGEARLEAWVRSGIRLVTASGWHGEFLAGTFFASGEHVIPVLTAEEITAWTDLGLRLQTGREILHAPYQGLPPGFASLARDERVLLLSLCCQAAETAPRPAAALFAELPSVVAALSPDVRAPLLRAFAATAGECQELVGVLGLVVAVLHAIPDGERFSLISRAALAASRFPEGLVPLLRSLPRAREETDAAGLLSWIDRGEVIAAENRAAGRAYFALESRTSLRSLRESSVAARLEEVQGVLRSYVRMLFGASLTLRATGGPSLRPFLDVETLARDSIALPEKVDLFDSWEENFTLLKLMTANGVARLVYGTLELSLARVAERLPAALGEVLSTAVGGDTLAHLLEAVPEADPLLSLLTACEGARLDARLRAAYRGYDADLRGAARRLSAILHRERRRASPELLIFLLGAGQSPFGLATRELPEEVLESVAAALLSPSAQPEDALAVAILLRERLEDSLAISGLGPPSSYEELLFEKGSGEALFDPELASGEEAAEGRTGATELLDLAPAEIEETEERGKGAPLSADELRRLLQAGAILKVGRGQDAEESAGLFATNLPLSPQEAESLADAGTREEERAGRARRSGLSPGGFDYDEWDYQIRDYRNRWCHLEEVVLAGDAGEFFQQALLRYASLLPEVRRQFQRIRPERYLKIRGLEDGEDFDFNAAVNARVELRARCTPSPRLYVARRREERDVATLFLLDMSASTDEAVEPSPKLAEIGEDRWTIRSAQTVRPRRIIDVTKEALVIMAEALEELGDRYAIYGFSGQGRTNVEFYPVKHFNEGLTPGVRGRIGGIEPRRSTRMGVALRHAITKMANLPARSKHILLLSDGFPQDFDYGTDRRSNTYALQDTMMALQECQAMGITPFCITVDKTGHDYLREMCETSRYLVIDDVASLPIELPKIYERWVRA